MRITDLGKPNKVLGILLIVNKDTGGITIHQKQLIDKAIIDFEMTDAKPKYTPLPTNVNLLDS